MISYFNLQRFCLHDGPGIRTTLFLKGCPLDCVWCHNPESKNEETELLFNESKCTSCGRCVGTCPARKIGTNGTLDFEREECVLCGKCVESCFNRANSICGKTDTVQNIFEQIKRDKSFFETSGGGMTISGGEPAFQASEVLELIKLAKTEGISCAVETCGFADGSFFRSAAESGAIFLYDIKGIDREKHKTNTGVYPDVIHKNLDMLLDMGATVIVRLPIIPTKNDSRTDLSLLCDFLSERKGQIKYAEILPYHELGSNKTALTGQKRRDDIPSGRPFASEWKRILTESGVEIRISGE